MSVVTSDWADWQWEVLKSIFLGLSRGVIILTSVLVNNQRQIMKAMGISS